MYLPYLMVIGLIEMEISVPILVLTWIVSKKLNSPPRHIARFLKSGIPIYNSEVPDTADRKTRRKRKRTQAIATRLCETKIARSTSIEKITCLEFISVSS